VLLLAFACVLLLAVLVSALAGRTILSTAVLFLAAGFLLGRTSPACSR
jgi:NhaP-type Na+/H+ or K+/H+ antiporter